LLLAQEFSRLTPKLKRCRRGKKIVEIELEMATSSFDGSEMCVTAAAAGIQSRSSAWFRAASRCTRA